MKVARLYDIDRGWYKIQRLWSQETIFSKQQTTQGKEDTLERLRKHRDDIQLVISELNAELESEAWLD